jgi:hypothetical protein
LLPRTKPNSVKCCVILEVGVKNDMMSGALIETSARRLKNEAENETKKRTALKLLKRGKQTVEKIAEDTGLNFSEVEQLAGFQTV